MLDELDVDDLVQVEALASYLDQLRILLLANDLVRKEVLVLVNTDQSIVGLSEEEVKGLTCDEVLLHEACLLRLQVHEG